MNARGDKHSRVRMPPAVEVVSAGLIVNLSTLLSDSMSRPQSGFLDTRRDSKLLQLKRPKTPLISGASSGEHM
jgi:hypothetical protein